MSSILDTSYVSSLISPEHRRCWIILIDGTWCDKTSKQGTVITKLDHILVNDTYQVKKYVKGIGASYSTVEKYIGGATGHGIRSKLFDIWIDLVSNYCEGDEIVILGYSRGAYMAVVLASLLDLAGIPQCQDDLVAPSLFNSFWKNELEDHEISRAVKTQYKCLDVPIKFLGCFDSVGAFGVPKTGVLGFLKWTPRCVKSLEFNKTELPSNVLVFRHALSLHEYRAPFTPTLMHIPSNSNRDILQVWFPGSHHDLGCNLPHGTGLVNIGLAWMISELLFFGVRFNGLALACHFPRILSSTLLPPADNYKAEIYSTWTVKFKATGYRARVPGSFGLAGLKTNEKIHRSARLRVTENDSVVPGHKVTVTSEGKLEWKKRGTWKKNGTWVDNKSGWYARQAFMDRTAIGEAEMRIAEAKLLGWSLE